MWKQIFTPTPALDFLRTHTYAHLDPALWDSQLWLYGDLERGLADPWRGSWLGDARLFAYERGGDIGGIALAKGPTVLLDTCDADVPVTSWLCDLATQRHEAVSVAAARHHLAAALLGVPGAQAAAGDVTLFTCAPARDVRSAGEELALGQSYQFWENVLSSLDAFLRGPFRVFGLRGDEGRIVSTAGFWPLSIRSAELTMVGTNPAHLRKGSATAVCALALDSALRTASMVTWRTGLSNAASIGLARKLGFRELVAVRHITVPPQ